MVKVHFLVKALLICVMLLTGCGGSQTIEAPTEAAVAHQAAFDCLAQGCWAGISPVSTTAEEAQTRLLARYGSEHLSNDPTRIVWASTAEVDGTQGGIVYLTEQGVVEKIFVGFVEHELTVENLISQLGEPDSVYVATASSSTTRCAGTMISYPDRGIHAWLYPDDASVGVRAAQSISALELISTAEAQTWTITDAVQFDWQGYVEYCELMPPLP